MESVVYRRKSSGSAATAGVLFMHGGPHHAVWDSFAAPILALMSLNVTIVSPNYRGSTGYGEAHLHALPGHAGDVRSAVLLCACMQGGCVMLDQSQECACTVADVMTRAVPCALCPVAPRGLTEALLGGSMRLGGM